MAKMSVKTRAFFGNNVIIDLLRNCANSPESFLESQPEKSKEFKRLTKVLFDVAKTNFCILSTSSTSLSKLFIKGFDNEQIWQQISADNDNALKYLHECITDENLVTSTFSTEINDVISEGTDVVSASAADEDESGYIFDDDSDSDDNAVVAHEESDFQKPLRKLRQQRKSSTVDDQFFKLSQLEEFLKLEDLKQGKGSSQEGNDEDSDIDMFGYLSSDDSVDDEDLVDSEQMKKKKDVMYEDFFDPPEDDESQESDENANHESVNQEDMALEKKYDTRDYDDSEYGDMQIEPESNDLGTVEYTTETSSKSFPKTAFEIQQEKEKKKMRELEESLLTPKPWQLTGEVAARSRPENSLMHQPTTFDSNAPPNIVITDDLTEKVENIVKMAITNKVWNDVERKIKPKGNLNAYKRKEELSQTKSKKGLAEVYEEQYLKIKHKLEEEENPQHVEIKKLMDTLVPELNALFAFIPKPPVPEIKVVNNLPAVTIEDVAPTSLSDAALLAPEEVKQKAVADFKGDTERNITDKKRERRKKKVLQKMRQKKTEEKSKELSVTNPALAKKLDKEMALKKLKQQRNTHIVKGNESKGIKSSKDFFSQLQDKVQLNTLKHKRNDKKNRRKIAKD